MGVHDLFKLLEPAHQPLKTNDVRGKIIAVDISVWLHQFVHGTVLNENSDQLMISEEEQDRRNVASYLRNLFLRFCKLWYQGARIVVVFDGQTPLLKKRTVAKRLKQKRQDEKKLQLVAKKILKNRLEGVALNRLTNSTSSSGKKKSKKQSGDSDEEFNFALPGYEQKNDDDGDKNKNYYSTPEKALKSEIYSDPRNWEYSETEIKLEEFLTPIKKSKSSASQTDSIIDVDTPNSEESENDLYYHYDIDSIDAEVFSKLPTPVQQQLLKNLRKSKRYAPAGKISNLQTQNPESFSNSQLNNFIHARNTHKKLQSIMQTTQESQQISKHANLLTPKLEQEVGDMNYQGGQLASDENTEYVLFTTPDKDTDRHSLASSSQRSSTRQSLSQLSSSSDAVYQVEEEEDGGFERSPKPTPDTIEIEDEEDDVVDEDGGFESTGMMDTKESTNEDDEEFESVDLDNVDLAYSDQETIGRLMSMSRTTQSEPISKELFPASIFEKQEPLDDLDLFPASMFEKRLIPERVDTNANNLESEQVTSISAVPIESTAILTLNNDFLEASDDETSGSLFTNDTEPNNDEIIGSYETENEDEKVARKVQEEEDLHLALMLQDQEESSGSYTITKSVPENSTSHIMEIIDEEPAPVTKKLDKGKGRLIEAPPQPETILADDEDEFESVSIEPTETIRPAEPERIDDGESKDTNETNDTALTEEVIKEREMMIEQMRDRLSKEQQMLRKELTKAKKSSRSISEHLISKTKALLQAVGVPYVDAPYEADAQCGFMCRVGLVDAVISEDSDMLLFGCPVLYRRFFGSDDCQVYNVKHIEEVMGLRRREFIQLGMLLGCDYTDGVHGVGIVTGIQICDAFNKMSTNLTSSNNQEPTVKDVIEPLKKFAEWVNGPDDMFDDTGGFKFKFRNIRRNFVLPPDFPDERIAEAFINPSVDASLEEFAFGTFGSEASDDLIGIDVNSLYQFCRENMEWDKEHVDRHLQNLIRGTKKTPGTMDYYLSKKQNKQIRSEGIKRAVKNLTTKRKIERNSTTSSSNGTGNQSSSSLSVDERSTKKRRST